MTFHYVELRASITIVVQSMICKLSRLLIYSTKIMRHMSYMHLSRQQPAKLGKQVLNKLFVSPYLNPDCQKAKNKFARASYAHPTSKVGIQSHSRIGHRRVNKVVNCPVLNKYEGSIVRRGMFDYAN